MKKIIITASFITLWITLYGIFYLCFLNIESRDNYEIVSKGDITVLLDKRNGAMWRNVWCDNKEKIPHCWSYMEYRGMVVPDAEQSERDLRFKNRMHLIKYIKNEKYPDFDKFYADFLNEQFKENYSTKDILDNLRPALKKFKKEGYTTEEDK